MMNSIIAISPMVSPRVKESVTKLLPLIDDSILLVNVVLASLVRTNGFSYKDAQHLGEGFGMNLTQSYVDRYSELYGISVKNARTTIAHDFLTAFHSIAVYLLNDFIIKQYITKAHVNGSKLMITSVNDGDNPTMVMVVL